MKHRFKRAFTITELVIVIAVIAILAAVLIPTFASVIDESKKSHDTQYMKEINVAIADYTATHGQPPEDYEELMLALADQGLCDANNPFLLATELKQDNVVLVWYPHTDKVRLVDTSTESMLFVETFGYGNGVQLYVAGEDIESSYAYLLCNTGDADSMAAAEVYRQLYILAGGSLNSFLGSNDLSDLVKDMENKSWANSIVNSVNNAKQGYTYDQGIAQNILDGFKGETSAQVDLTQKLPTADQGKTTYDSLSSDGKIAVEQGVRGTLATLSNLENDSKTKDQVAGKQVKLNVPEGTEVDMSQVTLAPIGQTYRKEQEALNDTPKSTLSVDFGNVTLKNMTVPEESFTSTGAEPQTANDCGREGGGYAFTYGMFGTVIAAPGQTVTIENLTIKHVDMNFKGATENINGSTINTFADNAGVLIGYAQGDVVLKNITIDGSDDEGNNGTIAGYDAIAGVVGRAYGPIKDNSRQEGTLRMEEVHVKNLNVQGERRAAGFIGYFGGKQGGDGESLGGVHVELNKCSLENVVIDAKRDSSTDNTFPSSAQCWAMALANISNNGNNGATTMLADGVTLTDVYTSVNYFGYNPSETTTFHYGGSDHNMGGISYSAYAYILMNAFSDVSFPTQFQTYNTLFLVRENGCAKVKNFKISYTDADSSTKKDFVLAGAEEVVLALGQHSLITE